MILFPNGMLIVSDDHGLNQRLHSREQQLTKSRSSVPTGSCSSLTFFISEKIIEG